MVRSTVVFQTERNRTICVTRLINRIMRVVFMNFILGEGVVSVGSDEGTDAWTNLQNVSISTHSRLPRKHGGDWQVWTLRSRNFE